MSTLILFLAGFILIVCFNFFFPARKKSDSSRIGSSSFLVDERRKQSVGWED